MQEENIITKDKKEKHDQMLGVYRKKRAVGWDSDGSHSRELLSIYLNKIPEPHIFIFVKRAKLDHL